MTHRRRCRAPKATAIPAKPLASKLSISQKLDCRYPTTRRSTAIICILSIIASILISHQFNCQTQYRANSDCATRNRNAANKQHQQHIHSGNQRQQRQFNQQRSAITSTSTVAPQPQPQERSIADSLDHEEFSLALGNAAGGTQQQQQASSNYTLLTTASNNEQKQQQQVSANNNTASVNDPQLAHQQQQQQQTASTTPALPNDSIGSPVVAQPPVTTSSSLAAASSTQSSTPPTTAAALATESPAATTSTQSSAPTNQGSESTTSAQTGNRHDDAATTSTAATISSIVTSNNANLHQTSRQQHSAARMVGNDGGHMQPVSSSPSSISIITPLNGSPTAHREQMAHVTSVSASIGGGAGSNGASDASSSGESPHSAMMKPLLVLGNPISERDYQQQSHLAGASDSKMTKSVADNVIENHVTQPKVSGSSQHALMPASRIDKSAEQAAEMMQANVEQQLAASGTNSTQNNYLNSDRMSGPSLVYSDGHLGAEQSVSSASSAANVQHQLQQVAPQQQQLPQQQQQPQATPRLFHGPQTTGAAVVGNNPRRPSLPPPVNQANAASGFRSPISPSGPLIGSSSSSSSSSPPNLQQAQSLQSQQLPQQQLQPPVNGLAPNFYQASPPYAGASSMSPLYSGGGASPNNIINNNNNQLIGYNKPAFVLQQSPAASSLQLQQQQQQMMSAHSLSGLSGNLPMSAAPVSIPSAPAPSASYSGRRPLNITRVEHISAECSNDLIKAVIVFNGTFKGIIYSSGYVSDPTCLYVNGTGSTRYEFHIRLNQCGTLGSEKLHHPTIPGEARRRDQVMFNTLSIQYNSIIEQEWDEHFKVSCEYGSDFWKTVSFSPFNVETNTGSPVVFTINPPQCQMDVLLGHGMGPKIVDGPVTVGDPLTLLIHMKSEKAGYDILVKNCVAHNGSKQKMQLIDSNGCVVNERFISPFRGTYNDNDLRHVTLYAYLKAFRFTGSPVLYLECEIHMCQSACPPQMCYWRRLSKRSVDNFDYEYTTNSSSSTATTQQIDDEKPVISESLSLFKALQVRQEPEPSRARQDRQLLHRTRDIFAEDDKAALVCYRYAEVWIFLTTIASLLVLVITIAATCCWRFRKLSKSQFQHNRLACGSSASSLSPSLLSISDAISSASSLIGKASMLGTPALAINLNSPGDRYHQTTRLDHQRPRTSPHLVANTTAWHNQQQQVLQKQQHCAYMQRQMTPSTSPAYRTSKSSACPTFQSNR